MILYYEENIYRAINLGNKFSDSPSIFFIKALKTCITGCHQL